MRDNLFPPRLAQLAGFTLAPIDFWETIVFDPDRLYRTSDPELEIIASPGALGQWRHKGAGPEYIKLTNRILYEGRVLNAWLDAHRVVPEAV